MKIREIKEGGDWYPKLEDVLKKIPCFYPSREAQKAAKEIGWSPEKILKIERRFETVYVIGEFLQNQYIAGVGKEVIHLATGEWISGEDGIKRMGVIELVKVIRRLK